MNHSTHLIKLEKNNKGTLFSVLTLDDGSVIPPKNN